jgi:AAA ATPase domain
MLSALTIKGFKRFAHEHFALRELTVLAGMNGTGKTSVIHALLLMHEACRRQDGFIELNGPYDLELGNFSNLQNWDAPENMHFSATTANNEDAQWQVSGTPADLYAGVRLSGKPPEVFSRQGRLFQYLSAERLGPRVISVCAALPLKLLNTGHRGQFCAQLFHSEDKLEISANRCTPDTSESDSRLFRWQAERWLSRIVRPLAIDTEALPIAGTAALRFRIPDGEWVRPTNMGFGVSYALPIILAGLIAYEGGLLIVSKYGKINRFTICWPRIVASLFRARSTSGYRVLFISFQCGKSCPHKKLPAVKYKSMASLCKRIRLPGQPNKP